uniref:Uncharacterized protein n=1 Tax=Plectus sambesii TaxID=2011161 RepID=A0A914WMY8_9BILA
MSGHAFNSDSEILAKLGIISDGPSTSSSPRRTFRPSPPEQRPGSGASFEEVRIDDWTPIGPRSISDFSDDDEFEVGFDDFNSREF